MNADVQNHIKTAVNLHTMSLQSNILQHVLLHSIFPFKTKSLFCRPTSGRRRACAKRLVPVRWRRKCRVVSRWSLIKARPTAWPPISGPVFFIHERVCAARGLVTRRN